MAREEKKAPAKGRAKKKAKSASSYYAVSGGSLSHKKKACPKCGSGTFMAEHQNRFTCGKCMYTEFKKA